MKFSYFIELLGDLHDAKLVEFIFNAPERKVKILFDDIYSNFAGFPIYPGECPGEILFDGVTDLISTFNETGHGGVYSIESTESSINIKFWPSGRIYFSFASVMFPTIHEEFIAKIGG